MPLDLHKAALEAQKNLIISHLSSLPANDAVAAVSAIDADKRTPLHWAATACSVDVARVLCDVVRGDEEKLLEIKDESGWTALHVAASAGSAALVQELLYRGANPDVRTNRGQTPLHYAASKGHVDVGRILLERGNGVDDINARDNANQCPIHRAASGAKDGFIRLLLNPPPPNNGEPRKRTRVNPQDQAGNTPLHLALESGHGSTAVLLLEEGGADRERSNADGVAAEDLEGVGGEEQKRVKAYVSSRCGERE